MAVSAALAVSAFSAHIGDEVRATLSGNLNIPDNVPTEVLHVTLDKGVWQLSAQIQFVERANAGNTLVGGAIQTSVGVGGLGDPLFQSQQTLGPAFMGIALASRTFEAQEDGTVVFLVGYNKGTPVPGLPSFVSRAYISGVKIRNLSGPTSPTE